MPTKEVRYVYFKTEDGEFQKLGMSNVKIEEEGLTWAYPLMTEKPRKNPSRLKWIWVILKTEIKAKIRKFFSALRARRYR